MFQKKIATIVFNLASGQTLGMGSEPHHGVILTYSNGKLVGVVFTKVPLIDLNAGLPPNNNTNIINNTFIPNNLINNSPVPGSNITPAMLANLQNTANMGLLNTTTTPTANNSNVQHIQNMRQQQQMMNTTGIVNPQQQANAPVTASINGKIR